MSASPALAQGITANNVMGAAPVAIALGAGAFALIAMALVRRMLRDNRLAQQRSSDQIAGLRARVDEYEALLSGGREIIVLWANAGEGPRFLGQASALLPPGRRAEAVLDFASWLGEVDADRIARAIENLRVGGRGFELTLKASDGRTVRASGSLLGNGAALRLRPAAAQPTAELPPAIPAPAQPATDHATARTVLASLGKPAFLRDGAGRLIFANAAYHDLARALGRRTSESQPAELVDHGLLQRNRAVLGDARKPQSTMVTLGEVGDFEVVDFPVNGGSAGYLHARQDAAPRDPGLSHLSAIIDALATPIAIFNPNRELVQFNRAYCAMWDIDPNWLKLGMDERAILDKLRTDGKLPNEPDYQGWRTRHLTSYQLRVPKELEPWHLPDGRTVQVIAAPAGPKGGVIYVFEDITDQLNLKSQHKVVLDVQRSTLNALSEAVAVFGTNGRLTLSNPKLSTVWKLPANLFTETPHIDQIAEAAARALPEDGATIWRDLKRSIIDLNPTRSDRQGRITRADGKLIDYAIVRLPDGQTMMTFLDVTESANYQRVLKERNDALITADRLKDAFVQNVSYELRSPLTNIIGFADLLASGAAGELNDKQHSYTDFIRASSATLGVLIDNILDLATVDAGIAELQPEPQDIATLVDKARAGLAATFPDIDGEPSLNLKVVIEPDLPPFIADGTRIVNVLYNLMSNAARFSEPGGEVRLTVSGRTGRIQFVVEDEGAPMSEEMRVALLDRNEALAGPVRQRGAGLGLSIVRAFVNMHGGTIAVERREPRGTRVVVSLPSDAAMAGAAE
ncbi:MULTISPECIES: PAS domain-containing sensor histidine kinase [unclassified Devosia]|uniref:sensor histidine kinase n=1 Tax=unclassified Devosia TaxID=196773 RepID=UPI001ACDC7DC|nr:MULTISPECIES: PAS domain-containing sensor histidine kinase [unclassified Devosia]MBN9362744.1 PAS-domain containing protein [Devosia sp.]